MKKTLTTAAIVGVASAAIAGGIAATGVTSGLSYQDSVNVTFTLNPTVNISLSSSDLTISDLAPGSSSDSNIITVTTSSNATAGYHVYGTVGNSTYNTENLKHTSSTDETVGIFAPLTTAGTIGDGEWGYNYPKTYDSASSTWTNWLGYANLPLYSSTSTGTELITSTDAGSQTIGFKIGAKAKNAQIAGDYNNVINFIAVAEDMPDVTYIQDLTLARCSKNVGTNGNSANVGDKITVTDSRDGKEYAVRYINGTCWMTQNLRYKGDTGSTSTSMIMKTATSNITADKTVAIKDLTTGDNSYTVAEIHDSGNSNKGVWYNYCAASGGSICTSSNSTTASQSVCPKNWTLPTSSQQSGIASSTYKNAFSPVTGGFYLDGSLYTTGYGYWWSATAYNTTTRYYLYYDGGSLDTGYNVGRFNGRYVRCIRTS